MSTVFRPHHALIKFTCEPRSILPYATLRHGHLQQHDHRARYPRRGRCVCVCIEARAPVLAGSSDVPRAEGSACNMPLRQATLCASAASHMRTISTRRTCGCRETRWPCWEGPASCSEEQCTGPREPKYRLAGDASSSLVRTRRGAGRTVVEHLIIPIPPSHIPSSRRSHDHHRVGLRVDYYRARACQWWPVFCRARKTKRVPLSSNVCLSSGSVE